MLEIANVSHYVSRFDAFPLVTHNDDRGSYVRPDMSIAAAAIKDTLSVKDEPIILASHAPSPKAMSDDTYPLHLFAFFKTQGKQTTFSIVH